jgi:multidrug resistance protein MdtO
MSAQDQTLTAGSQPSRLDDAGVWFWGFLKNELSPYPGRAWTVGRVVISATIVMVVVMTFQIPYGFLGAIYTMLLSRENPTVTLRSGVRTIISYVIASIYTVLGVMTMIDDPLTHFLWITISLFLAFYLIRVVPDYVTAVGFGFTLAGAIPLWDETFLTVNQRTENTLWLGFSVVLGTVVTVAVEYVFRRVRPATDLNIGIEARLKSVESLLRQIAAGQHEFKFQKEIALYSSVGTSRLRRILLRSGYPPKFIVQMTAAVALLGRLMDLAASLQIVRSNQFFVPEAGDRDRCLKLADQIAELERDVAARKLPKPLEIPSTIAPSALPLLPEMERTVVLMSHTFAGYRSLPGLVLPPPIEGEHQHLFAADAFTNPDHLKFAIRGTLATLLAYTVYTAIAWPGLSTSIATCIITALSTIGSSRQKQFLRLGGAILGGFVLGMGAQVFVLPYLDSITGFTVLFAVVSGISAWIATSTPRLSYLGVQMALAFYLINLQEFAPQYSLAIARDRIVGVLLGLVCMWLVFDRLWVRDALQEMQDAFARNLRLLAELLELRGTQDKVEAIKQAIQLRDRINEGFNAVKAQADAVVFEFGPTRQRKLQIRNDMRRWQATLGTLLQVQITYLQYLFQLRLPDMPASITEAQTAFEKNLTDVIRAMSAEVCGSIPVAAPDIQASAMTLKEEIQAHYSASGSPIPPPLIDMITLTQNLASIVAPLSVDIHSTFTTPQFAAMHQPGVKLNEA